MEYKFSEAGLNILKRLEGFRSRAYKDIGGIWTIGYGQTYLIKDGKKVRVKEGDIITEEEGDKYLRAVVNEISANVKEILIKNDIKDLNQNMFDALVIFAYNVGINAFAKSTLLQVIKKDKFNFDAIKKEFLRWVYVKSKKSVGLVNRRIQEFNLYKS